MLGKDWRLIFTGPRNGADNMAIDEALLDGFDPGASRPVLRLYGWNPPALSLGRFQDPDRVLDLPRCRQGRVDVVRRITGGGVIYHDDELTYAIVCAPRHLPFPMSVRDSYRTLNRFLLAFYRGLGLRAGYAVDEFDGTPEASGLGARTSFCYAGLESFDILVEGRKVGGNAQRRTRDAIFQHGSIPLQDRLETAVGFLREKPSGLDRSVASLSTLGVRIPKETLMRGLADAFAAALGVTLVPSALTCAEREKVAALAEGRYALPRDGPAPPVTAAPGTA